MISEEGTLLHLVLNQFESPLAGAVKRGFFDLCHRFRILLQACVILIYTGNRGRYFAGLLFITVICDSV